MEFDINTVKVAVEILKSSGQKVTTPRIADLTGYNAPKLYQSGILSDYLSKRRRRTTIAKQKPAKEALPQNVDAYIEVIKDGYFTHPESLEDVQIDMAINYEQFNPSFFGKAINMLESKGVISRTRQGYILQQTKGHALVGTEYVVLNLVDGSLHWVDEKALEAKIGELSKTSLVKLKVYKADEVVELTRKKLH